MLVVTYFYRTYLFLPNLCNLFGLEFYWRILSTLDQSRLGNSRRKVYHGRENHLSDTTCILKKLSSALNLAHVTVMKAHFETHFKKKRILFPDSLVSHTWEARQTSEPDDAVYATESLEEYQSDGGFLDNTNQSDGSCKYSHEQVKCNQERSQSDHCVSSDEIAVNSDDLIALDEEGGVNHGTLSAPLDTDEALSVECITILEDSCEEDLGLHEMPLEI
ncbi:hypothetical protein Bca52824_083263 [Brassica carinata]|uniref:Uncharacterized protein n=1 Tax=Brassica carinata TaxID=52824 RepID=A0A8X7TSX6_BRACI|nr:hypothetical protein Bca52824_083263 [Brassica carinata]